MEPVYLAITAAILHNIKDGWFLKLTCISRQYQKSKDKDKKIKYLVDK